MKVKNISPSPLKPSTFRFRPRWHYNLNMTLVIASKCKQGILVASDGKGRRFFPSKPKEEVIEDAQKIIFLGDHVAVLAFGSSLEDFDESLDDFRIIMGLVVKDNPDKTLDLAMCKEYLPQYFREKYPQDDASCGFIVAGYNFMDRKWCDPNIFAMDSKTNFRPLQRKHNKDYFASGTDGGNIAEKHFNKLASIAGSNVDLIANTSIAAICEIADKHPDEVNKNISMWLMTEKGAGVYDQS